MVCLQHLHLSKVDRLCLQLPMSLGFFLCSKPLSCTLDESIAQAPLHCCHRHLLYLVLIALLLPLLHGISPVYSIEHIPNLPLLYLVLIAPNFRCFGHKFLWETSIDFILDSLELELRGAFEYPKIYCNFLLRSSRILMRTVSSCEFIRRCQ